MKGRGKKTRRKEEELHTWLIPQSWMLSTIFMVSWPPRDVPRMVPPRLWLSLTLLVVKVNSITSIETLVSILRVDLSK